MPWAESYHIVNPHTVVVSSHSGQEGRLDEWGTFWNRAGWWRGYGMWRPGLVTWRYEQRDRTPSSDWWAHSKDSVCGLMTSTQYFFPLAWKITVFHWKSQTLKALKEILAIWLVQPFIVHTGRLRSRELRDLFKFFRGKKCDETLGCLISLPHHFESFLNVGHLWYKFVVKSRFLLSGTYHFFPHREKRHELAIMKVL